MRLEPAGTPFDFEAFAAGARSVLELGCGDGAHVPSLVARCRFGSYIGIDIDAAKIEAAQRKFGGRRVRFMHANLLLDDIPAGSYDLIFAHDVFVLLDHAAKEDVLRRLILHFSLDGAIVLNEFSPRVLLGNAIANLSRGQLTRVAYFTRHWLAYLVSHYRGREPAPVEPYRFAGQTWYAAAAARLGLDVTFRQGEGLFLHGRNVRYFQRLSDRLVHQRDLVILRFPSHAS